MTAAIQVIILGSGGGPLEANCTAILVRSMATKWSKGSILAVDAGVHLSAIQRVIDKYAGTEPPLTFDEGVFDGLTLPYTSSKANASHISNELVGAYLITHPHLDHISGLVLATANAGPRPKRIAGLEHTIEALKEHVFNDIIWPNLTDENNGHGKVTFLRLISGESALVGGNPPGYVEICEGLSVKAMRVSHGIVGSTPARVPSSPRQLVKSQATVEARFQPINTQNQISCNGINHCVYNSSAFFIYDTATNREVLIWGDVEADSVSYWPRNRPVWAEAARKIVAGKLKAVFIECSSTDDVHNSRLYGHLKPRVLIAELSKLASEVRSIREHQNGMRKRKHGEASPRESHLLEQPEHEEESDYDPALLDESGVGQNLLRGVMIVVIHVKDTFSDVEEPTDIIMRQLLQHEELVQLGCEFVVSKPGTVVYA